MSWSAGYVRLDDRTAAPHPALRERPAFVIQDVARTMRTRVDEQLREGGLTWLTFSLLLVAAPADRLSQQALASKARIEMKPHLVGAGGPRARGVRGPGALPDRP